MSTIRVSGDSSGYYDLTVPSTAGTNTIDLSKLPTTSAKTLAVDAINHTDGTSAMTISSAGVISQPALPCFHVTKNADQSVSDATIAVVTFESVTDGSDRVINKGGLFANNKFTVTSTTTGVYYFYATLLAESSQNTSDSYLYFRKNGTDQHSMVYPTYNVGSYQWQFTLVGMIELNTASDYVELILDCDQANSAAMNINYHGNYHRTEFGGYKVR